MTSLLTLVVVGFSLFGLAYLTKRRFGVLGLALAAGSLLSTNWASTLTPFIEQQGIQLVMPPLSSIVQSALILFPPLLLLLGGPTYNKLPQRVMGSLAFALLALAFLLGPMAVAMNMDGEGAALYEQLVEFQSLIIVVGLCIAIADVFFTRNRKSGRGSH